MHSTLVFNDLWKYICQWEKALINLIDARELAKWELRDEKALALLRSHVTNEIHIHIENAIDAWNAWKLFKKMFDIQSELKQVELHTKLIKQELVEGGDVLEHISHLKNIRMELIKADLRMWKKVWWLLSWSLVCHPLINIFWKH